MKIILWNNFVFKLDFDFFFFIGFLSYLNFGLFCKGLLSLIVSFSIFLKLKCVIFIDFLKKKEVKINFIFRGLGLII